MLEFQQFNHVWDSKMGQYEDHAQQLLNQLAMKHKDQLITFQQALISKPEKARFSRELFNLRKIQDTLAKQKNYTEAHKIKLKADSLQSWEMEKWKNKKQVSLYPTHMRI